MDNVLYSAENLLEILAVFPDCSIMIMKNDEKKIGRSKSPNVDMPNNGLGRGQVKVRF
jgi:hypothetical protein